MARNDAWRRYLAPSGVSEPLQRNNADEIGTSSALQTATAQADVAVQKREKPAINGHCSGVAVETDVRGGLGPYVGKQRLRNDDPVRISHFANSGLHDCTYAVMTLLEHTDRAPATQADDAARKVQRRP